MKNLIVFATLTLLFACSHENEGSVTVLSFDDFKETEHLKSAAIRFDTIDYGYNFILLDSILYVNNKGADKLISAYNLNTGHKVGSFLNKGRANNELSGGPLISVCEETKQIVCSEPMGMKSLLYSFDEFAKTTTGTEPVAQRVIQTTTPNYGLTAVNNDHFATLPISMNCENRLFFMDNKGDSLFFAGNCPKTSDMTFSDDKNYLAFEASMVSNVSTEKLYVFNKRMAIIEIYDFDGNLEKQIKGPVGVSSDGKMNEFFDSYFQPLRKGESIWVIYKGVQASENENTLAENSKIFKFNHKGVPLKIYELDQVIIDFDVDEAHKTIYASTETADGEIVFVKFPYNS